VLVAGGSNGIVNFNTAELYDPLTGVWTIISNMTSVRVWHTASVLTNAKVLVAGGTSSSSELYQA
jgi:hypothetical protein